MDANIKGALAHINRGGSVPLEHRGKVLSHEVSRDILKWADYKGYKLVSEIKDEEVDKLLNIKNKAI